MRASVPTATLVSVLVLGGCASGAGGSGASRTPGGVTDHITLEELEPYHGQNVLVAVQSLRPRWLVVRTRRTFVSETSISIIVDGLRRGTGVDLLRDIQVGDVSEIRYLSSSDATTMFGVDMAGGAIMLYTRR